jgi:hypothetical protein
MTNVAAHRPPDDDDTSTSRDGYALRGLGELADLVRAVDALGVDIADREDVRQCRVAAESLRIVIMRDMGVTAPGMPEPVEPPADDAVRAMLEGLGGVPDAQQLVRQAFPAAPAAEGPPSRTYAAPRPDLDRDGGNPPGACEGCRGPLGPEQVKKGARACQASCRVKAHRARQRNRRLAALDAAASALAEARAEIARG